MTIKSVAVIGAGAAGAITAAALVAERYFDRIAVFERRASAGGTWIFDPDVSTTKVVPPGKLPPEIDQPLNIPSDLPTTTSPSKTERWSTTPIYQSLTTNVPDIAMSFSDSPFPYGPFVPHYVARQYVENHFAIHGCDHLLELNTTLEDLSAVHHRGEKTAPHRWRLTLRTYDPVRHVDTWREELFDAVVLATGHYSVPFIPYVPGLESYQRNNPNAVMHSKYYRNASIFRDKKVLVIGNSASGHDVSHECIGIAKSPVYVSRRSRSKWDGDEPPQGIAWKPIITEYRPDGRIVFSDGTWLDDIDIVVYCTGYKPSFPYWNKAANGGPLWDYDLNKIKDCYWHTFLWDFPTIAVIGMPRTLTFRSFEYQAIAIARLWSGRNALPLPPREEQIRWEQHRLERCRREHKKFHDIPWDDGETQEYLDFLFRFAGLGTLHGEGRRPPALGPDLIWAIEHIKKYPEPPKREKKNESEDWVMVEQDSPDTLSFL